MASEKPRGTDDLMQQFRELGQELERSIRRAWESDEAQEVREQIGNGIKELGHQLNQVVEDVQRSETYQDVQHRVKDTLESPQVEQTSHTIREELDAALASLNEQLNKLIKAVPGPKSDKK